MYEFLTFIKGLARQVRHQLAPTLPTNSWMVPQSKVRKNKLSSVLSSWF